MAKIPVNKYPNQAGYLQFDTNTNELEVFSDGNFKSVTENNEYFSVFKHSRLLHESTTDFYSNGQFLTDLSTFKTYILARKTTQHAVAPSQVVKINIGNKKETVLLDGLNAPEKDFAPEFVFYYDNQPYYYITQFDINDGHYEKTFIINPLTGAIIKEDDSLDYVCHDVIKIGNDFYMAGEIQYYYKLAIIKYSPETNSLEIMNAWDINTGYKETEISLGKINGKLFGICRNFQYEPKISFWLYKFNDDWSIRDKVPLDLGHPVYHTSPYIFRKGNKVILTYISRGVTVFNETPGQLFAYNITEHNDNFNFELKYIYNPLLAEDTYNVYNEAISSTGMQVPTITPYRKTGLIAVEDKRLTPLYQSRFYQLDYDNDISIDYTNF